jgi:hypothetical protein
MIQFPKKIRRICTLIWVYFQLQYYCNKIINKVSYS